MFSIKNTRNVFEKKVLKKFQKSFREKILENKLKNRRLGLKINKNKSTQVGFNILGLNMKPKNIVFQYETFLTTLVKMLKEINNFTKKMREISIICMF
jgi:hypothetical protein